MHSLQALARKLQGSQSQEGQIHDAQIQFTVNQAYYCFQAHLQICPEYTTWRAAGNGQELAPPNPYNATGRKSFGDSDDIDDSSLPPRPNPTRTMQKPRSTVNVSTYFDEFFDDSLGHKVGYIQSVGPRKVY